MYRYFGIFEEATLLPTKRDAVRTATLPHLRPIQPSPCESDASSRCLPGCVQLQRIMEAFVEHIKQFPGVEQVTRRVKVEVPGKHFPGLQPSEQKHNYTGVAAMRRRQIESSW